MNTQDIEFVPPQEAGLSIKRRPERPLEKVSDFVCEELPNLIERLKSGTTSQTDFAQRVLHILSESNLIELTTMLSATRSPHECRLAQLDLVMIGKALEINQILPGDPFSKALGTLEVATKIPPHLTYELIILANPETDMRVFTTGDAAKGERTFYRGHQEVERVLHSSTTATLRALEGLDAPLEAQPGDTVVKNLEAARHSLQGLRALFTQFFIDPESDFNRERFDLFRPYLESGPDYSGPSALFSGRMLAQRVAIMGAEALDDRIGFFKANERYYPKEARDLLDEAMQRAINGQSVLDYAAGRAPSKDVSEAARQLCQLMHHTMAFHYGVVRMILGDLVDANGLGTAGKPIKDFLLEGVRRVQTHVHALRNSLRDEREGLSQ